ncbi:Nuclease-like protein OS=Ureibacillus acetophenoni OX=614649 GN=SAMN05877842_1129 PE=4 SV=1 [Ureibacillus acetophenoni]
MAQFLLAKYNCLILNDLLLESNKKTFQIDTLIISSNKVYFYEVKNNEGDHYYESDKIYKFPKVEIANPINQLSRSDTLLKQLILSLGYNIPIEGLVVFINPEFTLYQSPLNKPFLYPTQIKHYLKQLDSITSKITSKHRELADKLITLHRINVKERKYSNLPEYQYVELRKGITCAMCESFSISLNGRSCICNTCGHVEKLTFAVIRSVREFKKLFPEEKITTNKIHDWCKIVDSKRRIRRILENNFNTVGVHQWTYYE